MPPLTAEPTCSVFHFKNKISANKVRKYETASEKGYAIYEELRAPTPVGSSPTPSVRHNPDSTGPPPPKKPRTNLRNSDITLSAAAPQVPIVRSGKARKPPSKIDLSVHIVWEDGIRVIEPEYPPDSDVESIMSSLTPPPPSDKESPFRDPPTPEDVDYGRDFQSYYVIDDEGGAPKKASKAPAVKPPKAVRNSEAPREQPPPQSMHLPQQRPVPSQHHTHAPRPRQATSRPAAPLPLPGLVPQPRVHMIENIQRNFDPSKPATVAEMIVKLDLLSTALDRFGGPRPPPPQAQADAAPSIPSSRYFLSDYSTATDHSADDIAHGVPASSSQVANPSRNDDHVDGLLAMFDDDEDTDEADQAPSGGTHDVSSQRHPDSDYPMTVTGVPDGDLTYGIHFIMNALTTWARQTINKHYTTQWEHYNQMVHQVHILAQPKKGRGRPKKDEPVQAYANMLPPPPPSVVHAELTHTQEGRCVQAFQDVLDCGVLRVNDIMHPELIRALGTLYVQIDNLINNLPNKPVEPPWQCMSYSAQIKAHNIEVRRWKEQVAKMHEEVAKQQELSHQQQMMQMNVPSHLRHRGSLSAQQAARHHDMSLELKRGGQHANHQPHLAQSLTTPMDLDTQRPRSVAGPASSASPANAGFPNPLNSAMAPPAQPVNQVDFQTSSSRVRDPFAHVTMYHDGKPANVAPQDISKLMMRSGQGMKFSFNHGNETARQLFGAQAFPSPGEYSSNIPRRGPMSAPVEYQGAVDGVSPHVPTPVLGSNAPPLNRASQVVEKGKGKAAELIANGTPAARPPAQTNGITRRPSSISKVDTIEVATKTSETPAPSVDSPMNVRKRKHSETANGATSESSSLDKGSKQSETVNGTNSESPAPEKRSRHTLRLGKRKSYAAASVTPLASGPSPAPAVSEEV